MTPHRAKGRSGAPVGTPLLDRVFTIRGRKVRIKRASGTSNARLHRALDGMLTELYARQRYDLLEALALPRGAPGRLSPLDVWEAHRRGALEDLPTGDELQALEPAWAAWVTAKDCSYAYRKSLASWGRRLLTGGSAWRIHDLPGLVISLRAECSRSGEWATFNRARAGALAFLRASLGARHRLWAAVSDVATLRERPVGQHPQTVARAWEIAQKLGPKAGPMWWTLCLTGMRKVEYFSKTWTLEPGRVGIRTAKRFGEVRLVPVVGSVVRPVMGERAFAKRLRAVAGLTPHAARKSYAHWLELAQVPRTRRRLYLGHGRQDVTDRYEEHEVAAFLAEDAERMRTHLGLTPRQAMEIVK